MKTTNKLTDEDIIKARDILENKMNNKTMEERFDEIIKETSYSDYTNKRFCCGGDYCEGDHNGYIKDFIQQEIELAKKKERERIVEMIKELTGEMRTSETDKIINLITNNK